jgi:hypothetical protein
MRAKWFLSPILLTGSFSVGYLMGRQSLGIPANLWMSRTKAVTKGLLTSFVKNPLLKPVIISARQTTSRSLSWAADRAAPTPLKKGKN